MSLNLLEFIVYGLAVWRLSYMLVEEDGPFELFNGLRWLVGVRWEWPKLGELSATNLPTKYSWIEKHWEDRPHWQIAIANTPYGLFDCIYCMSVWVAGIGLLLHTVWPQAVDGLAIWLALSAVAIIIKERLVL